MSNERTPKHIRIFQAEIESTSKLVTLKTAKEKGLTESDYEETYNYWEEYMDKYTDSQICEIIYQEMHQYDTLNGTLLDGFDDESEENNVSLSEVIVIDDKAYYCDENITFTQIDWKRTDTPAETFVKNTCIKRLNRKISECDVMICRFRNQLNNVIDEGSEDWDFDEVHWGDKISGTASFRNRLIRLRNSYIDVLKSVPKKLQN